MAVFFDTGGGDIYGGSTKKAVTAAMRKDIGDEDFNEIKEQIEQVSGSLKMQDPDDIFELKAISKVYDKNLGAYCVASNNC